MVEISSVHLDLCCYVSRILDSRIYREEPTDGGWGEARAGSPLGPGAGLHWQAVTQHSGKNPAQLSCIIHGSGLGGLVTYNTRLQPRIG